MGEGTRDKGQGSRDKVQGTRFKGQDIFLKLKLVLNRRVLVGTH